MSDMPRVLEATIWCPECQEDKFKLWSVPVGGSKGHRAHRLEPTPEGDSHKFCDVCGETLERRSQADTPPPPPPGPSKGNKRGLVATMWCPVCEEGRFQLWSIPVRGKSEKRPHGPVAGPEHYSCNVCLSVLERVNA